MESILEFGLVVAILSCAGVFWRITAGFGKRIDRTTGDAPKVAELEERIADLEAARTTAAMDMQDRVVELEERVDVTERVLSEVRSRNVIGPGDST